MTNIGRLEERVEDAIGILGDLLKESDTRVPQGKRHFSLLADLLLRAEEPLQIDGYPQGGSVQGAGRVSGSAGSEGHSDPVGSAVLLRQGDICLECTVCSLCGLLAKASIHQGETPTCGFQVGSWGYVSLPDGGTGVCRRCSGSGRRWADPVQDSVEEIEFRLRVVFRELVHVERCYRRITKMPKPILPSEALVGTCLACEYQVVGTPNDRLKRGLDNKCYLSWTSWKLKKENQDSAGGADFQRWLGWRQLWLKKDAEEHPEDVAEEIDRLRAARTLPPPSEAIG